MTTETATGDNSMPVDPAQAQIARATELVGQPGDSEFDGEAYDTDQWAVPAEAIAVAQVHATLAIAQVLRSLTAGLERLADDRLLQDTVDPLTRVAIEHHATVRAIPVPEAVRELIAAGIHLVAATAAGYTLPTATEETP